MIATAATLADVVEIVLGFGEEIRHTDRLDRRFG